MAEPRSVTEQWAEFATGLRASHIPEPTRAMAVRLFAGVVGVAVGNARRRSGDALIDALAAMDLSGPSPVLGRPEQLPPVWATLVSGTAMHDATDGPAAVGVQPAAPIVSAALTTAELVGASREELLVAIVGAIELATRLAAGLTHTHADRGWDLTGTVGHVGAAAASATLLELPRPAWCHALAIAATQAAGHREQGSTMSASLHSGKAAADAVEAVLLAERGFAGPRTAIDGTRGLAALMSSGADLRPMVSDLGSVWVTDQVSEPSCGSRAEFDRRVGPLLGDDTEPLWTAVAGSDGSTTIKTIFSLSRLTGSGT